MKKAFLTLALASPLCASLAVASRRRRSRSTCAASHARIISPCRRDAALTSAWLSGWFNQKTRLYHRRSERLCT